MFLTIQQALRQGTQLLEQAHVPVPRLTAEVLLMHALRQPRTYLYTYPEEPLSQLAWLHYGRYLHQRLQGEPTQYITKRQEFFGRDFRVSPDVLIPRPETEHLVEYALSLGLDGRVVVDVGTGSGIIAVTLALESRCRSLAVDLSWEAIRVARQNAAAWSARVQFLCGDLTASLSNASVEVIVSNPPYIAEAARGTLTPEVRDHEPALALFGGPAGTDVYARLITDAGRVLPPGGHLLLELGHDSLAPVQAMLTEGWREAVVIPDYAGIPRVLHVRWQP